MGRTIGFILLLTCAIGCMWMIANPKVNNAIVDNNGMICESATCLSVDNIKHNEKGLHRVRLQVDKEVWNRTGVVIFDNATVCQVGEYNPPEATKRLVKTKLVNVYMDNEMVAWISKNSPTKVNFKWR